MRLKPDPLDPVGTGLKAGDVNPEVRDMTLPSTRLRVWNPDMVVPPSELRCHDRRLMVQSLSASHGSLHRSYSLIAIIWPVESAERIAFQPRRLTNAPAADGLHSDLSDTADVNTVCGLRRPSWLTAPKGLAAAVAVNHAGRQTACVRTNDVAVYGPRSYWRKKRLT